MSPDDLHLVAALVAGIGFLVVAAVAGAIAVHHLPDGVPERSRQPTPIALDPANIDKDTQAEQGQAMHPNAQRQQDDGCTTPSVAVDSVRDVDEQEHDRICALQPAVRMQHMAVDPPQQRSPESLPSVPATTPEEDTTDLPTLLPGEHEPRLSTSTRDSGNSFWFGRQSPPPVPSLPTAGNSPPPFYVML